MLRRRAVAAVVAAAATSLVLAACSSGGSSTTSANGSGSSPSSSKVTLVWWNNANTGQLLTVFNNAIKSFEATHPNVTIVNHPMQNEQFKTVITPALRGSSPPDIFQQWGSGQQATQVQSGKLADISSLVSSWIGQLGVAATEWQTNGKWYGVPYDLHVVGFWYRKDLFQQAGITTAPTTVPQLESDDAKLKAKGIAPVAVGSKDGWPDAFWWEYFAIRECAQSDVTQAMSGVNLSAACFTKATADLTSFLATNPFETGFAGVAAQVGAGSSAGMVANGKAAMELQGDWDPGVMQGLTSNKNLYSDLGWFPFPAVPGGAGDPSAVLGGGDGFSCTTSAAEPACEQFLQYLTTPTLQKQIIGAGVGLPANPQANSDLVVPAEQTASQANSSAKYIAEYFDIALPTTPGQNLDNAVAKFFAAPSSGTGAGIQTSVNGVP
jgi:raffinose/stachyose/melibiose transport system substrate-binding protein